MPTGLTSPEIIPYSADLTRSRPVSSRWASSTVSSSCLPTRRVTPDSRTSASIPSLAGSCTGVNFSPASNQLASQTNSAKSGRANHNKTPRAPSMVPRRTAKVFNRVCRSRQASEMLAISNGAEWMSIAFLNRRPLRFLAGKISHTRRHGNRFQRKKEVGRHERGLLRRTAAKYPLSACLELGFRVAFASL